MNYPNTLDEAIGDDFNQFTALSKIADGLRASRLISQTE